MKIKILIWGLLALTLSLSAMSEERIKSYVKNYIEEQSKTPVKSIDVISSYQIDELPEWKVYFLSMKVGVKLAGKEQEMQFNKTVFSNGKKITFKLLKKGKYGQKDKDYSKLLKPKVPEDAYDEEHLLIGSKDAPHKILFFSDPFCPFCREKFPEVYDLVKKNSDIYGLYYYHLPLIKIHPASDLTTKAMHIFQKRGEIDKMMALYDLFLEPTERDPKEIIHAIKEKTGVTFTLKELNAPEVKEAIEQDLLMKRRLMVTGTPTIFIDGEWDRSRKRYKQYAIK